MFIPYSALVALHLIAVAVFLGGLLVVAFILPGIGREGSRDRMTEIRRLRAMSIFMVTPALLLVWALGVSLAVEGGWFAASWLHGKIALVVALSSMHGYQAGQLRRLAQGQVLRRAYRYWWAGGIAVIALAIVCLATGKPG